MATDEQKALATREFQYDRIDLMRIYLYSLRGRRLVGTLVISVVGIFEVLFGVDLVRTALAWAWLLNPLTLISTLAVDSMPLFVGIFVLALIIRPLFARPPYNVPRTFAFAPEGMIARQGSIAAQVGWPSIVRVVRARSGMLMYLNHVMAYVVPKRAFDDPAEASAFYDAVEAAWREGKDIPAAIPAVPPADYSVRFALSKDDYLHGFRHLAKPRSGRGPSQLLIIVAVFFGVFAVFPNVLARNPAGMVSTGTTFLAVVLVLFALSRTQAQRMLRIVENPRTSYAPAIITLTPASLISAGSGSISEMGWDYIASVNTDERLIYIRLKNSFTIFTPRAAFASPPQADAFLAAASAYLAGHAPVDPVADTGVWPPPPRG